MNRRGGWRRRKANDFELEAIWSVKAAIKSVGSLVNYKKRKIKTNSKIMLLVQFENYFPHIVTRVDCTRRACHGGARWRRSRCM